MDAVAIFIGEHLNLNMPRMLNEPFDINVPVLKSRGGFRRSSLQRMPEFILTVYDGHAPSTAPRRGFYDHGKPNLARYFNRFFFRIQRFSAAGNNWDSGRFHGAPGFNLVAHQLNDAGPRPDELD